MVTWSFANEEARHREYMKVLLEDGNVQLQFAKDITPTSLGLLEMSTLIVNGHKTHIHSVRGLSRSQH